MLGISVTRRTDGSSSITTSTLSSGSSPLPSIQPTAVEQVGRCGQAVVDHDGSHFWCRLELLPLRPRACL